MYPDFEDVCGLGTNELIQLVNRCVEHISAAIADGSVTGGECLDLAVELHRSAQQFHAAHLGAVAQAEASGMWGVVGHQSPEAWLRSSHLLSGRQAKDASRNARWLQNQSAASRALSQGSISADHVQVMRRVATSSPLRAAAFYEVAADFVTIAENANVEDLSRALRSWADAVDQQQTNRDSRRARENRRVFLSPVGDGWDLQGWLPAAEGAELAGILNEQMEQSRREHPDDPGSASMRRADALLEVARMAAQGGMMPAQRERARLLVLVPLARMNNCRKCRGAAAGGVVERLLQNHTVAGQALASQVATGASHVATGASQAATGQALATGQAPANTAPGGWTSPSRGGRPPDLTSATWRTGNGVGEGNLAVADVRRLACDGVLQRVVVAAESTVLDVGRRTRIVPAAIRTALEVRDGGCVIPQCERPPGWCEAHHVQHWADGGVTSLQNLALLCSRHHHELHNELWRISIDAEGSVHVSQRASHGTSR